MYTQGFEGCEERILKLKQQIAIPQWGLQFCDQFRADTTHSWSTSYTSRGQVTQTYLSLPLFLSTQCLFPPAGQNE